MFILFQKVCALIFFKFILLIIKKNSKMLLPFEQKNEYVTTKQKKIFGEKNV